jgi:hypothetical protein
MSTEAESTVNVAAVIVLAVLGLAIVGLVLKRTARAATMAAAALLLALIAYYVWPTPYRFYSASGRRAGAIGYRENRLTGSVDMLTARGWVRIDSAQAARETTDSATRRHH